MSRNRVTFLLLSLIVLLPLVGGAVLARSDREGDDSLFKYLSVFQDVLRLVRQAYVDQVSVEQLMDGALDGAGDALDPFTTYVPADEVAEFRAALDVGTRHSGLVLAKDRGVVYVISVTPGSPAAAAGLERGDIVTALAGESTRSLPLWWIQSVLAGAPGETVALSLLRDGAASDVELTLGTYEPPLVELVEEEGVPLLRIAVLADGTAAAARSALEAAGSEGTAGQLLIDLRETVSDRVESAYDVGRLFAAGELGMLASSAEVLETFVSESDPIWKGEIVVLLGRGSIGAAEVLAAVLREAAGATVVGQTSFGYAGRLALTPLTSGDHVLLTDAFYSGPNGDPIITGLEPDVEVTERTRSYAERGLGLDELTMRRALDLLAGDADLRDVA